MLSDRQLRQIMPRLGAAKASSFQPHLDDAMARWEVDTWRARRPSPRSSATSRLPTRAARRGNTEPGDGKRYKGRGPIQVTGRSDDQRFGTLLGIDLVGQPALAATPAVGFQIAGALWKSNGLNELADAGELLKI